MSNLNVSQNDETSDKNELSENEVSLSSFDSLKNVEIRSPEVKTLNDESLSESKSPNNGNTKGKKQEEKEKVQRENVTDAIIKAFTVKRRKAMIDEIDNDDDIVDYETSERRILTLAIILALDIFEVYLVHHGNAITIFSDHNPLTFLKTMYGKNARLTRWALALQPYNINIQHVKGHDNLVPDYLSRCV